MEALRRCGTFLELQEAEQRHVSGGNITGEVRSPTFQSENPRSDLNWLCLALLLEDVAFKELDFRWCLGGGCAAAAKTITL